MVARIKSSKSIRGLLNYNENKVTAGQAQLIMASLFGTEVEKLKFSDKLNRLLHLTELNDRVKTNSVHIMLNFDVSEKPDMLTMQQIATAYMDKIGFGDQPYLVYKHDDAAHAHIHIVTTNIETDGNRISLHNIGKTLSEPARKELEVEFGLVKADSKAINKANRIKPISPEKAVYGKTPTKRAITNVVGAVVSQYKFTSLPEFNAVLKQFNVTADRGKEGTLMFEKQGLIYSILDENGNKIGIPFKASSLNDKPTLNNLEARFAQNEEKRKPFKESLKNSIEKVFINYKGITKDAFIKQLQKQHIQAVFRQNEQGITYGVTFIDNYNKAVFNGSDLGKAYTAKGLNEKFGPIDQLAKQKQDSYGRTGQYQPTYLPNTPKTDYLKADEPTEQYLQPSVFDRLLNNLMGKGGDGGAPLTTSKKKKKQERGKGL
ncbi:relaxase/mobilization nuclease domain-containing protein [Mucilaginibacter flavus]|uniref:relaxase/mobilization nuclease domain-containing protein n=1 Tax=Mucilaginibacter flavus TaxID=931504 RepID=UPI0025B39700|nr:relaxase/mobilization nuclease domain-containing protein [Mucilaginibacter flavus]MDN3579394.1 relaxase/mobilization nuclease domain-containing protein [Mucilaginibacter flavus]